MGQKNRHSPNRRNCKNKEAESECLLQAQEYTAAHKKLDVTSSHCSAGYQIKWKRYDKRDHSRKQCRCQFSGSALMKAKQYASQKSRKNDEVVDLSSRKVGQGSR